MSSVSLLLYNMTSFAGIVSTAPSGYTYNIVRGQLTVVVADVDLVLFQSLGFTLIGQSTVLKARVGFTTTQLLNMYGTPIVALLPSGTGLYYNILNSIYSYIFNTTGFTLAGAAGPTLYYGANSSGLAADAGSSTLFNGGASALRRQAPALISTVVASSFADMPLCVSVPTGEMTLGDGTGSITFEYTVNQF